MYFTKLSQSLFWVGSSTSGLPGQPLCDCLVSKVAPHFEDTVKLHLFRGVLSLSMQLHNRNNFPELCIMAVLLKGHVENHGVIKSRHEMFMLWYAVLSAS